MMMGHVFHNLHTVYEYKCEGFKTEDWIRITQQMPWLQSATSTRLVDVDELKKYEEHAIRVLGFCIICSWTIDMSAVSLILCNKHPLVVLPALLPPQK